ncbi:cell division protein FtsQ [Breznakia sp. PF5-3]|uniref:cell division protein FtsQ/DivIB n=1 Tax=unclassified Breznakia TaxID=2623764 RepID=UPI0024067D7C|nr:MULTISPECIES: FtsQ-type POTRA domain-containing protein [unclassified Breznakia]MDL2276454.1 FtsQ-type POTRA domain-containing protein [Breznakia sp. OttesenSCG-928-G09]MDF9825020.1 cell division protein FtsQ [Breznakia sp. PM6-1]MDF9835409.1 cell division protein FtsQ [Breznakia sp. PF5-3]MDF9837641.1 cell division protein FtsQ [Breznakia sp. PFB2-8]MDF9859505.1 cell division protein FtsQ [Breznakia sp. PH5-24]
MGRLKNQNRKLDQEDLQQFDEDTFDFEKVLEKDEQETRYDRVIKHRKKLKLRKKRVKVLVVLTVILLIGGYMLTSMSNIKILKVKNNVIYSQQQILNKAGLNYSGKMVFHPVFFIERALEKDELIKDVSVSKDYFSGAIYIDITEEKVIGYYNSDGKQYVLLGNGKSVEMKKDQLALISSPYLRDLNKDQRKLLGEELSKIDNEFIALISEIRHYKTSYDDNMLELLMQDGHIVRTNYDSLHLLESYREFLKAKNSDLRCIVFDETTNSSYTEKCEE